VLNNNIEIKQHLGANMFTNLIASHNMEDQLTTHLHFQRDVTPTEHDSMRFLESGLSMSAVAEAMHAQCMTAGEVMALPTSSEKFTLFVSAVCQSYTRSAHLFPYVSDLVMDDDLDSAGMIKYHLSESFKLPFREPFFFDEKFALAFNPDDCDGDATFTKHVASSFEHLEQNHDYGFRPDVEACNGKRDDLFMSNFFPAHMFNMTRTQKQSVLQVALKIGEAFRKGNLECHIMLLAAGAAKQGDECSEDIGGHAANVLVNYCDQNRPLELLMEGTNSITADSDTRTLRVNTPKGPMDMSMVQVANMLTKEIAGKDFSPIDSRIVMHVDNATSKQFYRTAFCQNGTLLATSKPDQSLSYGVSMQHLSDYDIKVQMPINPDLLNSIVENSNASDFLDKYIDVRRGEIHPPPVPKEIILKATQAWSSMKLYEHPPIVSGRDYKVCLASTAFRDPALRTAALFRAMATAGEWNANIKQQQIGYLMAYEAFDSVFTKLYLWTDNTTQLASALEHALSKSFAR
jgi:hypothetical protein